jgi:hypothetical protein
LPLLPLAAEKTHYASARPNSRFEPAAPPYA